jgi:hypothetical protein
VPVRHCACGIVLQPGARRSALLETQLNMSEAWLIDCTKSGTGAFKDLRGQHARMLMLDVVARLLRGG